MNAIQRVSLIVVCLAGLLAAPSSFAQLPNLPSVPRPGGGSPGIQPRSPGPSRPTPGYPSRNRPGQVRPGQPGRPQPPGGRATTQPRQGVFSWLPGGQQGSPANPPGRPGGRPPGGPIPQQPGIGRFRNPLQNAAPRNLGQVQFGSRPETRIYGVPVGPVDPGWNRARQLLQNGQSRQAQTYIDQQLSRDRSLNGLMSAVWTMEQANLPADRISRYRQQAFDLARRQTTQGVSHPLPYIAVAKFTLEQRNDAAFRSATETLRQKFPGHKYSHYFNGMAALQDEDWAAAEQELRRARELGVPDENIAQWLKMAIDNQKWIWHYAWFTMWGIVLWLLGLAGLYIAGESMSRVTLRATRAADAAEAGVGQRLFRSWYRVLLNTAGVYYYLSLPFVVVASIALPLTLAYALLHLPVLSVWLVAAVLLVSAGSVLTALSGIWAALARLDTSIDGISMTPEDHPRLWALVREVAARVGTRPVDEIVLLPATEIGVIELGSFRQRMRDRGRRVLILGVGVLDGFTERAFKSVLAHEYGHFQNRDTAGGDIALRVNRAMENYAAAITALGKVRWWHLSVHFLRFYYWMFNRIAFGASRLQEVLADRVAVIAYGPAGLKEGLVHAIRRSLEFEHWTDESVDQMVRSRSATTQFRQTGHRPSPLALDFIENGLIELIEAPTTAEDTHPSPRDRFLFADRLNVPDAADDGRLLWQRFEDPDLLRARIDEGLAQVLGDEVELILALQESRLRDIDRAVARHRDPTLLFARAESRHRLGDYDGAIEDLDCLIQKQPDIMEAWLFRAFTRRRQGQVQRALDDLETMQRQFREAPQDRIVFLLAECHRELQQWDEAERWYREAGELEPEFLRTELALAEVLLRNDKSDQAIQVLDAVIRRLPNCADAYVLRATARRDRGESDLAIEDLRDAVTLGVDHPQAHRELAGLLIERKSPADADEAVRQAALACVSPHERDKSLAVLAEAEANAGCYGAAAAAVDRLLAVLPDSLHERWLEKQTQWRQQPDRKTPSAEPLVAQLADSQTPTRTPPSLAGLLVAAALIVLVFAAAGRVAAVGLLRQFSTPLAANKPVPAEPAPISVGGGSAENVAAISQEPSSGNLNPVGQPLNKPLKQAPRFSLRHANSPSFQNTRGTYPDYRVIELPGLGARHAWSADGQIVYVAGMQSVVALRPEKRGSSVVRYHSAFRIRDLAVTSAGVVVLATYNRVPRMVVLQPASLNVLESYEVDAERIVGRPDSSLVLVGDDRSLKLIDLAAKQTLYNLDQIARAPGAPSETESRPGLRRFELVLFDPPRAMVLGSRARMRWFTFAEQDGGVQLEPASDPLAGPGMTHGHLRYIGTLADALGCVPLEREYPFIRKLAGDAGLLHGPQQQPTSTWTLKGRLFSVTHPANRETHRVELPDVVAFRGATACPTKPNLWLVQANKLAYLIDFSQPASEQPPADPTRFVYNPAALKVVEPPIPAARQEPDRQTAAPEEYENIRRLPLTPHGDGDVWAVTDEAGARLFTARHSNILQIALPSLEVTRRVGTFENPVGTMCRQGLAVANGQVVVLHDPNSLKVAGAFEFPDRITHLSGSPHSSYLAIVAERTTVPASRRLLLVNLESRQQLFDVDVKDVVFAERQPNRKRPVAIDHLSLTAEGDLYLAARSQNYGWLAHVALGNDEARLNASVQAPGVIHGIWPRMDTGDVVVQSTSARYPQGPRTTVIYSNEHGSLSEVKEPGFSRMLLARDAGSGEFYSCDTNARHPVLVRRHLADGTLADAVMPPAEWEYGGTHVAVPLRARGAVALLSKRDVTLVHFNGSLASLGPAAAAESNRVVPAFERSPDASLVLDVAYRDTLPGTPQRVADLSVSPDAKSFVAAGGTFSANDSKRQNALIRDLAEGKLLFVLPSEYGSILTAAYSPDGERIATGNRAGRVAFWDARTGKLIKSIAGPGSSPALAWMPDGKRLVIAKGNQRTLEVRNADGDLLTTLRGPHTASVWDVAISPDGRWIASGSADHSVRLWQADTYEAAHTVRSNTWMTALAFAPADKPNSGFAIPARLAVGDYYGRLELWDGLDGQLETRLRDADNRRTTSVHDVAWSPDGRLLATSEGVGKHSRVRFWDPQAGRLLGVLDIRVYAASALAFAGNDQLLVGCNPGCVKRFNVRLAPVQ